MKIISNEISGFLLAPAIKLMNRDSQLPSDNFAFPWE
jgi:hypothetical protein